VSTHRLFIASGNSTELPSRPDEKRGLSSIDCSFLNDLMGIIVVFAMNNPIYGFGLSRKTTIKKTPTKSKK